MAERLRLLDLGHHRGAAAGDLFGFCDVFGALNEGQRDPVDAGIERGFEIGAVLRHQARKRERRIRQADALARGQLAADFNPRRRLAGRDRSRHQPDLAVIEQQFMARLERRKNFRMRQVHARHVARRLVAVEHERCALA